MNQMMNKKGFTLGNVPGVAILLVTIAIVIGVGSAIISGAQDSYANATYAYNASMLGGQGLGTLASWQPTIALIVAAVVVIGIVTMIKLRQ
jgi:hypothetical protein